MSLHTDFESGLDGIPRDFVPGRCKSTCPLICVYLRKQRLY